MRKSLVICCGIAVMCLGMDWASAQAIVAHRGASHDAPENTLAAFRLAWEQGADAIEGDYYLTKDQQIVCIHDENTRRTSGVERRVSQSTLAELKQLDVGAFKGARWRGERIPTLSEVIQTVPADKKMLIEIKCGPEIVPELVKQLRASSLKSSQVVIISFQAEVIRAVRREMPEFKAVWIVGYRQDKGTGELKPAVEEVFAKLREIGAQGLDTQANLDVVTPAFVQRLRCGGWACHVWTINDPQVAVRFRQLGFDSITTDRPGYLRQELSRK